MRSIRMIQSWLAVLVMITVGVSCDGMTDTPKDPSTPPLPGQMTVKLREIPSIRIERDKPINSNDGERIKRLISSLAEIDSPDFGLSSTLTGEAFAPIDGMEKSGAVLLTNHQIKPSQSLRELVHLGPKALPYLLLHWTTRQKQNSRFDQLE